MRLGFLDKTETQLQLYVTCRIIDHITGEGRAPRIVPWLSAMMTMAREAETVKIMVTLHTAAGIV